MQQFFIYELEFIAVTVYALFTCLGIILDIQHSLYPLSTPFIIIDTVIKLYNNFIISAHDYIVFVKTECIALDANVFL